MASPQPSLLSFAPSFRPSTQPASDIQKAFRKGARTSHPDVSSNPDAEERFKDINEAYSVLSDPQKRELYDRFGENWQQAEQFEAAGAVEGLFRLDITLDLVL